MNLSFYYKLPVALQNLLTTIQGLRFRRIRYTKHTWETFNFLNKSQFWSKEKHEDYQVDKLRHLVEYASKYSPYYAKLYSNLKIGYKQIKEPADIRILPIISKEEFRKNNNAIISTNIPRKAMWAAYTAGTTGTPMVAYFPHIMMQERFAFLERLYQWYNPKPWRRRASFTGRLIVKPDNPKNIFHRNNRALNQQLFSSHHLIEKYLKYYVKELIKFVPEQVDGIASSIYSVAEFMVRNGLANDVKPKVVIPTSDTVWPHIRDRIEKAFQCKLANQYSSQEGAPFAYECPERGFHICPESGIFEILRPDNSPCGYAEPGRLVVTSFQSQGTPLIRYDIGDIAAWRDGECKCGRKMPMVENIEGRTEDIFYTNERGVIPKVDSAFKSLPNCIKATQVAQVGKNRFEVRIVPDKETYKSFYADTLINNLHDYLGRSVDIDLKIVSEIKRTSGGKLRAQVNECMDEQMLNAIAESWNRQQI
ncbi:MAG: hypothetical protein ABIA63_09310 [bacterium]